MARGSYGKEDGFDNATFRRGSVGRYTEWEKREPQQTLALLESWARDGYMDSEMWQKLRISENTFYRWKKQLPEVAEALKRGKEQSNAHIENTIFKLATEGWSWVEKEEIIADDGTITVKTKERFTPPDKTSLIFLLKNRMPDKYMDRRHVESNVNANVKVHDEVNVEDSIKKYSDTFKDTAKIVMGFIPETIDPTVDEDDADFEDDEELEDDTDLHESDDSEESDS
jgi:hypothetical protein